MHPATFLQRLDSPQLNISVHVEKKGFSKQALTPRHAQDTSLHPPDLLLRTCRLAKESSKKPTVATLQIWYGLTSWRSNFWTALTHNLLPFQKALYHLCHWSLPTSHNCMVHGYSHLQHSLGRLDSSSGLEKGPCFSCVPACSHRLDWNLLLLLRFVVDILTLQPAKVHIRTSHQNYMITLMDLIIIYQNSLSRKWNLIKLFIMDHAQNFTYHRLISRSLMRSRARPVLGRCAAREARRVLPADSEMNRKKPLNDFADHMKRETYVKSEIMNVYYSKLGPSLRATRQAPTAITCGTRRTTYPS